jgi:hypothetical protein
MEEKYLILKQLLRADKVIFNERLSIYFPNKDRSMPRKTIDVDHFVLEALDLLDSIENGATALPVANGIWEGEI